MKELEFISRLSRYMPEPACTLGYRWLSKHPAKLRITKPRTSKLGDFRVNSPGSLPLITVNGNLNPYSFALTFAHEVAHLVDFRTRSQLRDPHGPHWKRIYTDLLAEQINAGVYDDALLPALERHLASPRAASCSDPILLRALRQFDEHPSLLLREVPEGALFQLANGRTFQKGHLRRTRFRCIEIATKRAFLVHGDSEVTLIDNS